MRPSHNSSPNNDGNDRDPIELLMRLELSGGHLPSASLVRPVEAPLERWERLYSQGIALKEALNPAYLDAVVTIFAGAILATGKEQVKLLVIGGGDGHFSRKVLPAVLNIVSAKNSAIEVDVLETDLTEAIKRAPGKSMVVNAQKLDSHFGPGSFDVVIGEAMLHQGGPTGIVKTIQQIKHVLSKTGTFLHVQDTIPDPSDWIPAERLQELGVTASPILRPGQNGAAKTLLAMADEAHAQLARAIRQEVKACGGRFALMAVEGSSIVDTFSLPQTLPMPQRNSLIYTQGTVGGMTDPEVPSGKVKLTYQAMVSLVRPHITLQPLLNEIEMLSEASAPKIKPPED